MKLTDETITVFNASIDSSTGGNSWGPTVIIGASWYMTDATTVDTSKGGLIAASKATIRIPEEADTGGKDYSDPLTYAAAEDVTEMWTLQPGDIIVKGEADTTQTWTPAKLKAAYSECVTVLTVTDNRRAPNAPHWRVTAA